MGTNTQIIHTQVPKWDSEIKNLKELKVQPSHYNPFKRKSNKSTFQPNNLWSKILTQAPEFIKRIYWAWQINNLIWCISQIWVNLMNLQDNWIKVWPFLTLAVNNPIKLDHLYKTCLKVQLPRILVNPILEEQLIKPTYKEMT